MPIEKEDSAQSLVLRGRGNFFLRDQVSDKLSDFGNAHFFGMAFVMKKIYVLTQRMSVFRCAGNIVINEEHRYINRAAFSPSGTMRKNRLDRVG